MKFSLRFWTIAALLLLSSALMACSRAAEEPAASAPDQPAATAAPPSTPAPPPKTEPSPSAKTGAAPAPKPAPKPDAGPPPEVVRVPSGTILTVVMTDAVGTDTSKPGDMFTASIGEPVVVNGKTAIGKGTRVQGVVETVDEPGRVKGRAALSLVLTSIARNDKTYRIETEPFRAEAESSTKKDAVKAVGGAAIGAVVGAIAGGKKGAAVGAGVGAGAGTAAVLATKGQQLRIESETRVNFVLKKDVEVAVTRSTS